MPLNAAGMFALLGLCRIHNVGLYYSSQLSHLVDHKSSDTIRGMIFHCTSTGWFPRVQHKYVGINQDLHTALIPYQTPHDQWSSTIYMIHLSAKITALCLFNMLPQDKKWWDARIKAYILSMAVSTALFIHAGY